MSTWFPAPSVKALLDQATALYPERDRRSDGIIGDARHQAEPTSDHNPDGLGCVHAADVTHGPYWGSAQMDGHVLTNAIIARRDPRLRYMIFERRIMAGNHGPSPWVWRPYSGTSAHLEHVHVSVNYDSASENDTSPWYDGVVAPPAPPAVTPGVAAPAFPLRPGQYFGPKEPLSNVNSVSGYFSHSNDLRAWQARMQYRGWTLDADGLYGPKTEDVARKFQAEKGLAVDGLIGPSTWAAAWTAPISR